MKENFSEAAYELENFYVTNVPGKGRGGSIDDLTKQFSYLRENELYEHKLCTDECKELLMKIS